MEIPLHTQVFVNIYIGSGLTNMYVIDIRAKIIAISAFLYIFLHLVNNCITIQYISRIYLVYVYVYAPFLHPFNYTTV